MPDHQVPSLVQMVQHIILYMGTGDFGGEKVAGPGIMAALAEGFTDDTGELTGYENTETIDPSRFIVSPSVLIIRPSIRILSLRSSGYLR
jgi:hypothetical protein